MAQQEPVRGLPAYRDVANMLYPDDSTATSASPPPSYSSSTSRNVAAASPQQLNPKQLQEQQDHHHHHQQQQQQQQQHRHRQLEPVSVLTQPSALRLLGFIYVTATSVDLRSVSDIISF